MSTPSRLLFALLLLAPLRAAADAPPPPDRHRLAVAANVSGWRYYKSGQLARAELRFADAVALDPDYALAHYNLACVASRLRDVATAVRELRWLAASSDPVAAQKRAKAAFDPDLDFVSALPEVRELWRLPAFDGARPLEWLRERGGRWSTELADPDCTARSYTLTFTADATRLTVREACHGGAAHERTFTAVVTVEDGALRVAVPGWSRWPASVELESATCPGLDDAPGACFSLRAGDEPLGPFHRGVPGVSPMRAPRSLATAAPR